MQNCLEKTPFLRLIIPLIAGILLQYYFHISSWSIILLSVGLGAMLLSFLAHSYRQYKWRWLFGLGVYLSIFAFGVASTSLRQNQTAYEFSNEKLSYKGIITDIPQAKEKSIACKVQLSNCDKKVVCYLQKGVRSKQLEVGDEIMFHGKIERFKHFGNPDEFNYPTYMYNKGFSGTIYLFSDDWEASGEKSISLLSQALLIRKSLLNFYQSLNLNETEFSILSALTLGYKDALTPDLQQSFRTTGTAHILAVSGMHVCLIYGVILSIAGLFFRRVRHNSYIQIAVILCLWFYAFITGLPPSVIRATIMLSIFCVANIVGRKGLTYNNIAIAAFFMLLYNPFTFFDLGFQLSFAAVLSICFLQAILSNLVQIKNKYLRLVWELFTLSIAAQIGTFPICLYYFGTFPTYFFITNLLIVPLISVIIYLAIILFVLGFATRILPDGIAETIVLIPVGLLKFVIGYMVGAIQFFEQLPYSLIQDIRISLSTCILLTLVNVFAFLFFVRRKARYLISAFGCVLLVLIFYAIPPKNSISIYRNKDRSEITWNIGHNSFKTDSIDGYKLIRLGEKNFLSISSDRWKGKMSEEKFELDYLHILQNDSITLYSLSQSFKIKKVILDHTLSSPRKKKLAKECEKIGIAYYDISENGLFRTKF